MLGLMGLRVWTTGGFSVTAHGKRIARFGADPQAGSTVWKEFL